MPFFCLTELWATFSSGGSPKHKTLAEEKKHSPGDFKVRALMQPGLRPVGSNARVGEVRSIVSGKASMLHHCRRRRLLGLLILSQSIGKYAVRDTILRQMHSGFLTVLGEQLTNRCLSTYTYPQLRSIKLN